MAYVTLEGNIGVGKSTLLHKLSDALGWEAVEEGIESDEGFKRLLTKRYEDPSDDNVAALQLYVANFMANRINALDPNKYYIVERSVLSTELFSLAAGRDDIVDALAGHVLRVEPPLLYVYLSAPPKVCLERIATRNREGESNIQLSYLRVLHDLHEKWYNTMLLANRVHKVDATYHPNVKSLARKIQKVAYSF